MFLLFIVTVATSEFVCSSGCKNPENCISNYTCGECLDGYDQDGSCLHCDNYDIHELTNTISVWTPEGCSQRSYLNDEENPVEGATKVRLEEIFEFNFSKVIEYRQNYCNKRKYVQGLWVEFDSKDMENETLYLDFKVNIENNQSYEITINIVTKFRGELKCVGSSKIVPDESCHFEMPKNMFMNDGTIYYFFFSTAHEIEAKLTLRYTETNTEREDFYMEQSTIEWLAQEKRTGTATMPIPTLGYFGYPICMPHIFGKMLNFWLEFNMSSVMLVSTKKENRIRYLEEFDYDENGNKICVNFWSPFKVNGTMAIYVLLHPEFRIRNFTLISQEHDVNIALSFRVICPYNCNADKGFGYCSISEEKCICKDGYGGSDCHLLCYYNNKWQPEENKGTDQCYFGSYNCSETCSCEKGFILKEHLCVSHNCSSKVKDDSVECFFGEEKCGIDCRCVIGYKPIGEKCVLNTCGNGIRDEGEDCDGGEYCNEFCECQSTLYKPSTKIPQSCEPKFSNTKVAIVIVCCGVAFVSIFIVSIIVLLWKCVISKQFNSDTDIYLTQQPMYYMYISGSKKYEPELSIYKFSVTPYELDFGNKYTITNIFETRFQTIEIQNNSRNKWLMIIFHTPNNPKYVFYFEPQVKIIPPKTTKKVMVYMTLFCTTKIKDVCIPHTVWLGKNKKCLQNIEELLRNKSFENWNKEDQNSLDLLCKNVMLRYHGNFVVATEAVSSTHIDMDEIRMSEKPIAEGSMGKLYVGSYRSIVVAVKQFRWENLTEEEMDELKKEVINECEIMSKLRNPFIANYIGSVTYVQQISMVMQFFVLGSLSEYLRQDKEDYVKLPYRLKIRMLFDTARGMEFLHENRIMHLDLKPDNLLVNSLSSDNPCCIKITDFGTSRFTKKTNKSEDKGLGTPVYASPESYHDEYTFAGDIYSFGIMAWELFYQEEPYKEFKSIFEIKEFVGSGKRLGFDEMIPQKLKGLIKNCWDQKPNERPTFDQILNALLTIVSESNLYSELDKQVNLEYIQKITIKRNDKIKNYLEEDN